MHEHSNDEDGREACPRNGSRSGNRGDCISSHNLLSEGQCWICHDGQRYQLRVTAANKLILTK